MTGLSGVLVGIGCPQRAQLRVLSFTAQRFLIPEVINGRENQIVESRDGTFAKLPMSIKQGLIFD